MTMRRPGFFAAFAITVLVSSSSDAQCLPPTSFTVDVGITVSTTGARVSAPAQATLRDGVSICYSFTVSATIKIKQDASLEYIESGTGHGQYTNSLVAPAQVGSCYNSSFTADAAGFSGSASDGPICWYGPPAPPPQHTTCVQGNNECQDPLVLDLNGDGIRTTRDRVWFDMDGDGALEQIAWTNPATEEGFLYLDLDHKGRVTNGSELFGVGTVMPDGSRGRDGFAALAVYDSVPHGGNSDGILDASDAVWNRLRLWVDTNHDGVCDPTETGPIHKYGVQEITVTAALTNAVDDAGNVHLLASAYRRKAIGKTDQRYREYAIHAIGFQRIP